LTHNHKIRSPVNFCNSIWLTNINFVLCRKLERWQESVSIRLCLHSVFLLVENTWLHAAVLEKYHCSGYFNWLFFYLWYRVLFRNLCKDGLVIYKIDLMKCVCCQRVGCSSCHSALVAKIKYTVNLQSYCRYQSDHSQLDKVIVKLRIQSNSL